MAVSRERKSTAIQWLALLIVAVTVWSLWTRQKVAGARTQVTARAKSLREGVLLLEDNATRRLIAGTGEEAAANDSAGPPGEFLTGLCRRHSLAYRSMKSPGERVLEKCIEKDYVLRFEGVELGRVVAMLSDVEGERPDLGLKELDVAVSRGQPGRWDCRLTVATFRPRDDGTE